MLEKSTTHVSIIGLGTLLCAFSLASIIIYTDPYTGGWLTHLLFYVSLFLFCLGLFALIGIFIRQRFFYGIYIANLRVSLRQALFVAILVTVSLGLQSRGLLYWWLELIFILFLLCLELFINL